ncbi:MAG: hypothetical protein KME35_04935 [Aphanocapsa sp. GSE-SYN-MK-11-07L]|jgi:hypothetical protein|nr:hypothetical protein [Aphanocapsa sp. GSE-SYN-MK-11-07L]
MTDYILFIHGVNTREVREQPTYADALFTKLQADVPTNYQLKSVPLYWGDINIKAESRLIQTLEKSPLWTKMWFRDFRSKQILQFAGDAALYISRYIGSKVVARLKEQAIIMLQNLQPEDQLHIVAHSWGTVILFDILFAKRWDNPVVSGHQDVMAIRNAIFGIEGEPGTDHQGIKLGSINTMGSPIGIFSLTAVSQYDETNPAAMSTHDITPKLQDLLRSLGQERQGKRLPWRNFMHPGDPVASPLKELLIDLVDEQQKYLELQDILIRPSGLLNLLISPLQQNVSALLQGGDAHGSYWSNDQVSAEISKAIGQ